MHLENGYVVWVCGVVKREKWVYRCGMEEMVR